MKKISKIISIVMTLVLMLGGLTSLSSAQEIDVKTLLNDINSANQEVESAKGDLTGSIYLELNGKPMVDLNISGPFMFNVDPKFSANTDMTVEGTVSSQNPMEEGQEEVPAEEISETVSITILDSLAYVFDGSKWTTEDISEAESEFIKVYEESKAEQANLDIEAINEKMAAYYDVEDAGDSYIVRLKSDIDSQAFWTDINEVMDIESAKEQAIAQAEKQAEEQGVEFTDAQRDQIDFFFNNMLDLIISMIDTVEMHYTKDTYQLTKMTFGLSVDETDIAAVVGMEPEALGITAKGHFNYEINMSNHGEVFDIQKPADAPEAPESVEEIESLEDSASEEEPASEEDMASEEETVEEVEETETSAN